MAGGKIERLNFADTDPNSDMAEVCRRLQGATDRLRQQEEEKTAAKAAVAMPADAPSHPPGADMAPAPSQDQHSGGQNSDAAAPKAEQTPNHAAPDTCQESKELAAMLQKARGCALATVRRDRAAAVRVLVVDEPERFGREQRPLG